MFSLCEIMLFHYPYITSKETETQAISILPAVTLMKEGESGFEPASPALEPVLLILMMKCCSLLRILTMDASLPYAQP